MEEEEVEELEECETEELEELEESSPGLCNQSTGGAFGVSHFLLWFFAKRETNQLYKNKKQHWVVLLVEFVCVCVLARKYLLNKT